MVFSFAFVYIELYVAPEPVLAPFLLKQKIPVLVGISNFLVATCNFTVMYNFPTWFQTVMLTSASEAGTFCCLHESLRYKANFFHRCSSHSERRVYLVRLPLCWVCVL